MFSDVLVAVTCFAELQPSSIMKTMQCLDAAHHSQSASLVSLLVNKFLVGHQLSVSRKCEAIVCRRLEGLIAETAEVFYSAMCTSLTVCFLALFCVCLLA